MTTTIYSAETPQSNGSSSVLFALVLATFANGAVTTPPDAVSFSFPTTTSETNQQATVHSLTSDDVQLTAALQELANYLAESAQDLDPAEKSALYTDRWDIYA